LKNLGQDKTRKILGVEVTRHNSEFIIDGEYYAIIEAVEFINSKGSLDYSAFILVRPGCNPNNASRAFRIGSKAERTELLKYAKSKNLYVYSGNVKLVDGKPHVEGPFAFIWDSMPSDTEKKPNKWPSGGLRTIKKKKKKNIKVLQDELGVRVELHCPYCSSTFSSTSGRTLHIKSKHPEEAK
jgi:hypothetical protein